MADAIRCSAAYLDKYKIAKVKLTVFSIAVIIALCLLVVLLVETLSWRQYRVDWLRESPIQQMCVSCDGLRNSDGSMEVLDVKIVGALCCGAAISILTTLIEKVSNDHFQGTMGNRPYAFLPSCRTEQSKIPVASLGGLLIPDSSADENTVLQWSASSPSFIKHGIRYSNGHLHIGKSGYYYVHYALTLGCHNSSNNTKSVSTNVNNNLRTGNADTDDVTPGPMIHIYVDRLSYRHRQPHLEQVLESVVTDKASFGAESVSSNAGAVLKLEENDEVFLRSSHPGCLVQSSRNNVFGLHMI